jgi:two-component system NarL family response regulator
MIRVLVVDDHPTFRQGLISVLQQYPDFVTVGQASNGEQAVAIASQVQPDIVVMDVCMPGGDGIAATVALQQKLPQVKVLIVTVSDTDDDFFAAIKAGAKGYLLKSVSLQELIDSIRLVAEGEAIVSPAMAGRLLDEFKQLGKEQPDKEPGGLSLRESEVLQLVAHGDSNKEIASRLFISETTVKAHLRAILEKLHARNRAEAVAVAAARGWLNK